MLTDTAGQGQAIPFKASNSSLGWHRAIIGMAAGIMRVFKWLILSRFKALMSTLLFITWIFLCLSATKNKILVRLGNENDFSGG